MTDIDPGASTRPGAPAPRDDSRRGRSRWLRGALALGLVAGLAVVVDGVQDAGGAEQADAAAIAAAPVAAVSEVPVPTDEPAPTEAPALTDEPVALGEPVGVEELPAVGVGDDVALGALETTVVSVEAVRVVPHGPGEIAGPGAAVRLVVRNASQAPVDLTGLVVTAASQDGATPAVPASGDPASPLVGELAPGEERGGTYVFMTDAAPDDPEAPPLRVEVGLDTARGVASVLAG